MTDDPFRIGRRVDAASNQKRIDIVESKTHRHRRRVRREGGRHRITPVARDKSRCVRNRWPQAGAEGEKTNPGIGPIGPFLT
jgi:hypothetical protein